MKDARERFMSELLTILRGEYVALLGQRGDGVETFVHELVEAPRSGFSFILVDLPGGLEDSQEFMELFVARLSAAVAASSESSITAGVSAALAETTARSAVFRLRKVLEAIGLGAQGQHRVLVLHAISEVAHGPLKNLLKLLREYHSHINKPTKEGQWLRVLAVGEERLWRLCCEKISDLSPFNIAVRRHLPGLSLEALHGGKVSMEEAVRLKDLTDGIPALVHGLRRPGDEAVRLQDCFRALETGWNALPAASQQVLKEFSAGTLNPPACLPDFGCMTILKECQGLDGAKTKAWMDAFWAGFLRLRHQRLTWRSAIHRAFVAQRLALQAPSLDGLLRDELLMRTAQLKKGMKESRPLMELLEEAAGLVGYLELGELLPVLLPADAAATEEERHTQLWSIAKGSPHTWLAEFATRAKARTFREELGRLLEALIHEMQSALEKGGDGLNLSPLLHRRMSATLQHRAPQPLSNSASKESAASSAELETAEPQVFICYARADNKSPHEAGRWLDRVMSMLGPLNIQGIRIWSDQDVKPGADWQQDLQQALRKARVAILLISQAFLNSDFIRNSELPVLLMRAKEGGLKILPIILEESMFHAAKFKYPDPNTGPHEALLSSLQTVNPPDEGLKDLKKAKQNKILKQVGDMVLKLVRGEATSASASSSQKP